jgi:peptidoglycan DL-endopeptidase CwlO
VTRRIADIYGIVSSVQLTDGGIQRIARTIRMRGRRRTLSAAIAVFAALGTLVGTGVAVMGEAPGNALGSGNAAGPAVSGGPAASPVSLPRVRPTTGDTQVVPGFSPGGSRLMADGAVPAAGTGAAHPSVAPLRRTMRADLLIVAPSSLSHKLLASVSRVHGVTAAEQIEAVRMRVNGTYTATLGVDPSVFRSFSARPTAKSDALWEGVADGGIAVSYTMGKLDKLPLGGTVGVAGHKTERLRLVAFGTMGIGGVDAVVSDAVARSLGAPAGNAIVVSAGSGDLTAVTAAVSRLIPHHASVEPLVTEVSTGTAGSAATGARGTGSGSGAAGAGSAAGAAVPASQLNSMLRAAMSRRGMPYVWGGDGPTTFDCSGLVQWSFAQAGVTMPRVAADQALTGPAVPVSRLRPGDLLFYHTDPTAPTYISHVAIYLGNGWMIQAPEPGQDVEVVPADFGSEFAGAVRVNPAQAATVAARVA